MDRTHWADCTHTFRYLKHNYYLMCYLKELTSLIPAYHFIMLYSYAIDK